MVESGFLTADFFQREHIDADKDLPTIAAEPGFSERDLHRYARQAGIKIV